jgi:hypothetical protein
MLRWVDFLRTLYMALQLYFVVYFALLFFRHPDIDQLRDPKLCDPFAYERDAVYLKTRPSARNDRVHFF